MWYLKGIFDRYREFSVGKYLFNVVYNSFVITCKMLLFFVLDFLPLKCDACKQDFCKDHFTCAAHKCPFAFEKVICHTLFQRVCFPLSKAVLFE